MTNGARRTTLDHLRTTSRDLVSLLSGVDDAQLARRPAPEEWAAGEVIVHLADAELVYATRLRLVVAQERPHLVWYDEEAWVERFGELDGDPRVTLARWRALRENNVRLLDALEDPEWQRVGIHDEHGALSVEAIADRMVVHDRAHLDQIRVALSRQ